MSDIDLPGIKRILWIKMRADLTAIAPSFSDNDLLLCPLCCRRLHYEDFSVEHIIPKQAVADDPEDARGEIARNERSGLTLLCTKPLIIKGKRIKGNGCNGWKGRYYDYCIRDVLQIGFDKNSIYTRHQIGIFSVGYLALFREFGYRIALEKNGRVMRQQFFSPDHFLKDTPIQCQMILGGAPLVKYNENDKAYWSEPFKFDIDDASTLVVIRNVAVYLPTSRDPTIPFKRFLKYLPPRYSFRPDFTTMFD